MVSLETTLLRLELECKSLSRDVANIEVALGKVFERNSSRPSADEMIVLQRIDRVGQTLCDLSRFINVLQRQAEDKSQLDMTAATASLLLGDLACRLRFGKSDYASSTDVDIF